MKKFKLNGEEVKYSYRHDGKAITIDLGVEGSFSFKVHESGLSLLEGPLRQNIFAKISSRKKNQAVLFLDGREFIIENCKDLSQEEKTTAHSGELRGFSPMPGKIFRLIKKSGDSVSAGETVLILEAMKMEHPIKAEASGRIKIFFSEGEQVAGEDELFKIIDEKS